ncbi:aminotransferase, partial [Streptomyces sp. NPDC052727]
EVLRDRLPQVRHHLPEATYLAWLDTRPLGLGQPPVEKVLRDGRVLLDGGSSFGPEADEFLRVNFGTSQQVLDEILARVTAALGGREG